MSLKIDDAEKLELHLKYLFEGVNFKERIITISEDIDDELFKRVDAALSEMESHSRKTITIRINSDGGEVYAANAIVGRIKASKCKIVTEGYGRIMSAATLILACGTERKVSRTAFFMYHESSYIVEGRHSEIKNIVDQQEKEERLWASWMEQYSNKDKTFWYEASKKDTYINPNDLLAHGVVDEII